MNPRQIMPPEAFAGLGGGRIAYVRSMRSEDIRAAFPNVPPLEDGLELWALLSADGTPIMVADNREALVSSATQQELETVSVH